MRHSAMALPCPLCGYDLRANLVTAGAACPECGRFTPRRNLIGSSPSPMQRKLVAAILLIPTAFAWLLAAIGLVAHRAGVGAGTIIALFVILWLASCVAAARYADRQLPRPDPAEGRADQQPRHQILQLIAASILINAIGALLSLLAMGMLSG